MMFHHRQNLQIMNILLGAILLALFYLIWIMISHPQPTTTATSAEDSLPNDCNLDEFAIESAHSQTDPCLLAFFKKKMLVAPRPPESLKTIAFSRNEVDLPSNIEKLKWVQMLLMDGAPKNTQFFFVDSGANDGRFLSSTVRLETLFKWNGVLIEPLPEQFKTLLQNRGVWAVNTVLCVTPHPEYVDFYAHSMAASSGLELDGRNTTTKLKLPCIPLYTILKALDVSVVDYISLDIEGVELQVLKTVPFDNVTFKIMVLEYNHLPGDNQIGQLMEFLEPKGYHLIANLTMDGYTRDCLFVHESVYQRKKLMIDVIRNI